LCTIFLTICMIMKLNARSRSRKKSLKHAPDHYRLAAMKRIARRASMSNSVVARDADAREISGFVPVRGSVRVLSWPVL
jgi:hypothetical protein